jgi:hypothetical protein
VELQGLGKFAKKEMAGDQHCNFSPKEGKIEAEVNHVVSFNFLSFIARQICTLVASPIAIFFISISDLL